MRTMTNAQLGRFIREGGVLLRPYDKEQIDDLKGFTKERATQLAEELQNEDLETSIEKVVEEYWVVKLKWKTHGLESTARNEE